MNRSIALSCLLIVSGLFSLSAEAARPLTEILCDLGNAGETQARQEAAGQTSSSNTPQYNSESANETITFEGTFVPASGGTKLAVFSDDGCDVYVNGQKIHGRYQVGQHLPDLAQSFHVLSGSFQQGQPYHVRVVYSNTIHPGAWDIDGCTLFAYNGGGAAHSVSISPESAFAGCGLDSLCLKLTATVAPDSPETTFFWSTISGTGSGIVEGSGKTAHFTGTSIGHVEVECEASSNGVSAKGSSAVNVLEVANLNEISWPPDTVSLQNFDQDDPVEVIYPYNDPVGQLFSIRIMPPESEFEPVHFGVDYVARVNQTDGSIRLRLFRDGIYMVQVARKSGGETFLKNYCICYNWAIGQFMNPDLDDAVALTGFVERAVPARKDLTLINKEGLGGGGGGSNFVNYLKAARAVFSDANGPLYKNLTAIDQFRAGILAGETIVGSLANFAMNQENQPFSLMIIDHGKTATIGMGAGSNFGQRDANGDPKNPWQWFDNQMDTKAWRDAFTKACRDNKVNQCQFVACCVANGNGTAFVQSLANEANITLIASTSYVAFRSNLKAGLRRFAMDKAAMWVTKSPQAN